MVSEVKSVCSSFANALSAAKKASFFIYFADGSETDCMVLLDMEIRTVSVIITGEDGFRCFVWFDEVTNAECETMPDGTTELRMHLTDGTEIAIDTCP